MVNVGAQNISIHFLARQLFGRYFTQATTAIPLKSRKLFVIGVYSVFRIPYFWYVYVLVLFCRSEFYG